MTKTTLAKTAAITVLAGGAPAMQVKTTMSKPQSAMLKLQYYLYAYMHTRYVHVYSGH